MTINDVMTAAEAAQEYKIEQSALRQRIQRGVTFKLGVDCRKTETGKRGDWLVTREAMDREYGKR